MLYLTRIALLRLKPSAFFVRKYYDQVGVQFTKQSRRRRNIIISAMSFFVVVVLVFILLFFFFLLLLFFSLFYRFLFKTQFSILRCSKSPNSCLTQYSPMCGFTKWLLPSIRPSRVAKANLIRVRFLSNEVSINHQPVVMLKGCQRRVKDVYWSLFLKNGLFCFYFETLQ